MRKIKNMTELRLYKQKLKYQEMLLEKDLINTTAGLTEHFTNGLKDFAFDFGSRIILSLFRDKKKKKKSGKKKKI